MKSYEIPVIRAKPGTPSEEMTVIEQDQAFRDSIPHSEHLRDAYYMVGCPECVVEESAVSV